MPYYTIPVRSGTRLVKSLGDGSSINVSWYQAYPSNPLNKIAYNIYYSTVKKDIFTEGVKFTSISDALDATIVDLIPGQLYFFCIRPVEYNPAIQDLSQYPVAYDDLIIMPSSVLRSDMTFDDLIIPLLDVSEFPQSGFVKVGVELINYTSVDVLNNNLIISSMNDRGKDLTKIRNHYMNGFDGYYYWNPSVVSYEPGEDQGWDKIFQCQSRFEYPNYQYTEADDYHQIVKDLLHRDFTSADEDNIDFPMYDYSGYHRTDPVMLVDGTCIGSYIGGEYGCIDGYGNYNILRGSSLQDQNLQRQEMLLDTTGRPAVLLRRMRTGITCACFIPSQEYPDDRCPKCYGVGIVYGYEQIFNPRRSDGRILVGVNPTSDATRMREAGLESEFNADMWTLAVPTIQMRDILILFDRDGLNEEFRYEVSDVTRGNTVLGLEGRQQFKTFRIRKTDIAYQVRAFKDTSKYPSKINTTVSMVPGIPPHIHNITRNENDPSTWSQNTSISQGHNHPVIFENGQLKVLEALGHTHEIIV